MPVSTGESRRRSRGRVAAPQRTRDNGPMTRSELIHRIAHKQSQLFDRDVERAVKMMLDQMAACLAGGGRIEIRAFGSFSLRLRPARVARNPRTGTPVSLPARYAPNFKPGKRLANVSIASLVGRLKRSGTRADQRIRRCAPASDPSSTAVMRIDALLHGNGPRTVLAGALKAAIGASPRPRGVQKCSRMGIL